MQWRWGWTWPLSWQKTRPGLRRDSRVAARAGSGDVASGGGGGEAARTDTAAAPSSPLFLAGTGTYRCMLRESASVAVESPWGASADQRTPPPHQAVDLYTTLQLVRKGNRLLRGRLPN